MPRPTDLRVQVNTTTRPGTNTNHGHLTVALPSPSLRTPTDSRSSALQLTADSLSTPPCTPPCLQNGFGSYLPQNANNNTSGFNGFPMHPGRRGLLRRNSSLSSVSSSVASEDSNDESEMWTEEEQRVLKEMFDEFVMSNPSRAPFNEVGPLPSNLTHSVAKAVVRNGTSRMTRSQTKALQREDAMVHDDQESTTEAGKWRHGLKSTRLKLLQIVKEQQQSEVEATPKQSDTPKRAMLARQGSMDFLPVARNIGRVAKLGSRLQRAELGPPPVMARTYSSGPQPRVDRTLSLSTIVGSPSQPPKQPTSTSMARMNSDTTGYQALTFGDELANRMAETGLLESSPVSQSSLEASPDVVPRLEIASRRKGTHAPKRDLSGLALGSAFSSPALGAYPTPDSQERKKKAKFTHHSPSNSLDLGKAPATLASGIELPGENKSTAAAPSSHVVGSGGTLGASSSFYLAEAASNGSISSIDTVDSSASFFSGSKHCRYGSLSSTTSCEADDNDDDKTVGSCLGTPSPLAPTFDLKRLSLHGLESTNMEQQRPTKSLDQSPPMDYFTAGEQARQMREQFGSFTWRGDNLETDSS
ncbi:hypothetical protein OIO90_006222 [Microbotryomycetes sp. JL221]|nr:hypothetical protein OIO90_006222 [Microbotryomycetes sp. JL221]